MKIKNAVKSFRKSFAKFLFDKREKSNKKLDFENVKSILFLRDDDKIGDMAVSTLLFREVKKKYPDKKIYVLCGKNNNEIIKNNPYVDEIIIKTGNLFKDLRIYNYIRLKKICVFVDFFTFRPRPLHLFMIRRIKPDFLIGFRKREYNMYDFSIDCDVNELHISKRYEILLSSLGIKAFSLDYNVFLDSEHESTAKSLFKSSKDNLIINPFAASRHRSFSFEKLQNLVNKLKAETALNIFIICAKKSAHLLNGLTGAETIETNSIIESAAYIKCCDYVISPDTSIVHIAAAFKKKMTALFLDYSNEEEKINKVWAPNYDKAVQISVDTKNGSIKNDINNIDNDLIIEKLTWMLK